MKLRKAILFGLLCMVGLANAQQMPPIPVDEAVRIGHLDNGLTYYLRKNGYPENRVNFYIAQRVGSIQENEDQRGLAHFLEHMAFNGTEHFKGNGIIDYTRSLGVEFGGDLNAYTSVDQTVYRICNVPSARVTALDSCLLILKDWSNGLLLEADEIDKERGVIHEEWRLRTSPTMRMLERNLEALYPGSKYGRRMPIGLMEIVDNFEPDVLRKYYQKWYRPDNQAIIVVGDIDVDRTEAKIKELFSGIQLDPNAVPVVDEPVPDNAEPIIVVDKDKEQQMSIVEVMFKHEAFPDSMKGDMGYMIFEYGRNMAISMLNQRLEEKGLEADCPFVQASASDGSYLLSKTVDAFNISVLPKEGLTEQAVATAFREAQRAAQFGFTETEYQRARDEYLSQLEKVYTNRDKRRNDVYGDACRDHFLSNEPMPSIEYEYQTMKQFAPMLPVDLVNAMLPDLISKTDSNIVVLCLNQEKEGAVYPSSEAFMSAINNVRAEQLTPYVDNVKDEPLMTVMPKKGKIKKVSENTVLGFKELLLSNGARVLLKPTDFKDDQIQMIALSKGGTSLLSDEEAANSTFLSTFIAASGLGNFSNNELQKAMAGKQASANFDLNLLHEMVSGECVPKDLETMMQLVYLTFTDIKKDDNSYNTYYNLLKTALQNQSLDPNYTFSDSLSCTLYNHNPRFAVPKAEVLDKMSYDRMLQIAKERTANAGDYIFTFVGNFDEATILPLIEQYIASLPGKAKKKENWRKVHTYAQGHVVNQFLRKMETPKANARMLWYNTQVPYSLENDIKASAAAQVLEMIYLKKIREEASAAYSAGAGSQCSLGSDVPYTCIVGVCPMKPEQADEALAIMRNEARGLCNYVDADMLDKVKEAMLNKADESAKENGHWIDVLSDFAETGIDKHTDYKSIVRALTPQSVAQFMKDVIFGAGSHSVEVIMMPEE